MHGKKEIPCEDSGKRFLEFRKKHSEGQWDVSMLALSSVDTIEKHFNDTTTTPHQQHQHQL